MRKLPDISGLRFAEPDSAAQLHEARRLQGQRYLDSGHVDRLTTEGYVAGDKHVSTSQYFVAVDQTESVIGVSRLIHGPSGVLPSLAQFELLAPHAEALLWLPSGVVAEVSALATAAHASRELFSASVGLYRAMFRASWESGVVWWVANWEQPLHRLVSSLLGVDFEVIGEPKAYMGAPTYPVALHLPTAVARLADDAPEVLELFTAGLGPHPLTPARLLAQAA